MRVFHSGKLPVIICPVTMCLMSVVVGGVVLAGGREGGLALRF